MPARLNRFLAGAGLGSRRAVEDLIRAGRVTVNGAPGTLGTRVEEGDDVRVDGGPVAAQRTVWLMLHKPAGVITTASDPHGRRTVRDLVAVPERVYPVGRLDRDTTGLLLLTNEGALANRLMHPSHGVQKRYQVQVEGRPADADLERLAEGVDLDDGRTAPATVRRLGPDRFELVLHEGRNRQVRRMCEAIGHPVRGLHRAGYADLELGALEPGAWRPLTDGELGQIRAAAGESDAPVQ